MDDTLRLFPHHPLSSTSGGGGGGRAQLFYGYTTEEGGHCRAGQTKETGPLRLTEDSLYRVVCTCAIVQQDVLEEEDAFVTDDLFSGVTNNIRN